MKNFIWITFDVIQVNYFFDHLPPSDWANTLKISLAKVSWKFTLEVQQNQKRQMEKKSFTLC